MTNRTIARVLKGQPTSDGDGVRLTRVISPNQGLDPFLLLDEFDSAEASDYVAGFPAHPHRGFETVTYMLDGHMLHEDHLGNRGHLRPGGVQWMTAGRGIIHSEMPQQEAGRMRGFQLWINLPGRDKMKAAGYRDLEPAQIPTAELDGARVRVVAGSLVVGVPGAGGTAAHGGASGDGPRNAGASGRTVTGPISGGPTEPLYFDVAVDAGRSITLPVPATHQTLAYTFEGAPRVGGRELPKGSLAILVNGDAVQVEAGDAPVRVLLIAGRPLREPVVHYGPFVMNTVQEIEQAIRDYQAGQLTSAA
jgi:redox-sensitive bicupin YhaK (pirin superfamily)